MHCIKCVKRRCKHEETLYPSQVLPVYIATSACACVSFQLPPLAVFYICLGSHCWASRARQAAQKNKEAKGWERREALGKRVVGENICTTGFRNRERFSSPTSSAIWKDQVFIYYHWLCSTREHFIHKVMGDGKGVPSCNFYRVYLYFNMVTLFCNSLQCLFI